MKSIHTTVDEIEDKIKRLIVALRAKRAEISALKSDLQFEKQKVDDLKARIQKLEEDNKLLRIAQTLTTGTDTTDTKDQIDQLVRELDKCITLLNG